MLARKHPKNPLLSVVSVNRTTGIIKDEMYWLVRGTLIIGGGCLLGAIFLNYTTEGGGLRGGATRPRAGRQAASPSAQVTKAAAPPPLITQAPATPPRPNEPKQIESPTLQKDPWPEFIEAARDDMVSDHTRRWRGPPRHSSVSPVHIIRCE
eukprot:GHVU01020900.1.p1 GENE.GHVU01020900.1~~GHVU01020900.1.p1  ORF type:complete len:152 (+),score=5.09 GHVU01020900.1:314-769(+)